HLGRDFGLEAEAIGLQGDALKDFAAKDLVTGLHIGELEIGEDIREQGEKFVGDVMPEVVDALGTAQKARAEDDVGATVDQRFEQLVVVARIVFEVGVLHQNDVARQFSEAAAQCGAFALIHLLEKNAQIAQLDRVAAIDGRSLRFTGSLQLQ